MRDTNLMSEVTPRQRQRALWLGTIAFAACFAVWTLFSIIGVRIADDLGLNETQLGLLLGIPVLTGSLSRLVLGIMADRFGGRRVTTAVMLTAALATFLLTFAETYAGFLAAGLALGLAGGTFASGVAYVSRWFPTEHQGTALGIFGLGNAGTAVTQFTAPFVMVAFGWEVVAQFWALAVAAVALLFWFFAEDDPEFQVRRAAGTRSASFAAQLAPLAQLRVWRFSLYYFFSFGAFVALALWLPRYYMEVYGVGIGTAGMLAAAFALSASLFRAFGGYLSDRFGARTVMYWTFIASAICTFILSYPPTSYIVHGIHGDIRFEFAIGVGLFTVLTFILGFFMALGMAAVYKHIPSYFPASVGAVGGVVGMIGGLGGFFLPLTFGMLHDVVGLWTSAFMLLFVLVTIALTWMHFAIMRMDRRMLPVRGAISRDLPELAAPSPLLLTDWNPEDKAFWQAEGRRIAQRNLVISIAALLLSFAVWMMWSVVVLSLPDIGFPYSTNQLFWLAALPGLSGATLRIFYSFMVPIFGGRRWTTISTASLLLPAVWIGFAVQNPDTPYIVMLILALLCGFGGGNFASSSANISFFYPQSEKGTALGLNAGLGNLGVSVVQFLVPLVIVTSVFGGLGGEPQMVATNGAERPIWLQNAGFIWVPFIALVTAAAWFGMNDIASAKASFSEQAVIFKRKDNWLMCVLYTGTFGSFIGYSAALPLLIKAEFPAVDPTRYAFLGPLIGALMRPVGGWLADRFGGARVTLWNFVAMTMAVLGVLAFMPGGQDGAFAGFLAMFLLLFVTTGIGNGSTFRMIPTIFMTRHERAAAGAGDGALESARRSARRESAAVLGFTSAIAAYGAFFIPKSFGTSVSLTGGAEPALYLFMVFYLICIALTWWYYARARAEVPC